MKMVVFQSATPRPRRDRRKEGISGGRGQPTYHSPHQANKNKGQKGSRGIDDPLRKHSGPPPQETRARKQGGEEEDNEKTKAATALENLVAKLNGPEYDLVREAMGACTNGYLASYTAPGGGLAKASVMSLIRSGVTLEELREGGYPERVLLLFQQVATNMATKSAAAVAKASKK